VWEDGLPSGGGGTPPADLVHELRLLLDQQRDELVVTLNVRADEQFVAAQQGRKALVPEVGGLHHRYARRAA